jgi:hypothetical protein
MLRFILVAAAHILMKHLSRVIRPEKNRAIVAIARIWLKTI